MYVELFVTRLSEAAYIFRYKIKISKVESYEIREKGRGRKCYLIKKIFKTTKVLHIKYFESKFMKVCFCCNFVKFMLLFQDDCQNTVLKKMWFVRI